MPLIIKEDKVVTIDSKQAWKHGLEDEGIVEKENLSITDLVQIAHKNAKDKGFWEDYDSICWEDGLIRNRESTLDIEELTNSAIAKRLMLITSEVSEALEALRKGHDNFDEELADIVIRTCDLAGGLDVDLEAEIIKKIKANVNRPYKHGKKF